MVDIGRGLTSYGAEGALDAALGTPSVFLTAGSYGEASGDARRAGLSEKQQNLIGGVSAAGTLLGSILSGKAGGEGVRKFLLQHGVSNTAAHAIQAAGAGAAFGGADTLTEEAGKKAVLGKKYRFTAANVGKQAAVGALFGTIRYVADVASVSAQNREYMNRATDELQREYSSMKTALNTMPPEEVQRQSDKIYARAYDLAKNLDDMDIVGADAEVSAAKDFLSGVQEEMNGYSHGGEKRIGTVETGISVPASGGKPRSVYPGSPAPASPAPSISSSGTVGAIAPSHAAEVDSVSAPAVKAAASPVPAQPSPTVLNPVQASVPAAPQNASGNAREPVQTKFPQQAARSDSHTALQGRQAQSVPALGEITPQLGNVPSAPQSMGTARPVQTPSAPVQNNSYEALEPIADTLGKNGKKAMIQFYDGSNPALYANGFVQCYNAGIKGDTRPEVSGIPEGIAVAAYLTGENDASASDTPSASGAAEGTERLSYRGRQDVLPDFSGLREGDSLTQQLTDYDQNTLDKTGSRQVHYTVEKVGKNSATLRGESGEIALYARNVRLHPEEPSDSAKKMFGHSSQWFKEQKPDSSLAPEKEPFIRAKKSDWNSHDSEWYVPGHKQAIAYSTRSAMDMIDTIADDNPDATISQLLRKLPYDDESRKVLQAYVDNGYGARRANDWFSYGRRLGGNRANRYEGDAVVPTIEENSPIPVLSDEERSAILSYKSSESYQINAKLRSGELLSEQDQRFVDLMDNALSKLPVHRGEVYRNLVFDDFGGKSAFDDFISEHAAENIVSYEAFTPASTKTDGYPVDGEYTVGLAIQGTDARDVDGFGNNFENEVIFPRGRDFLITEISSDHSGRPIIHMKEDIQNDTREYGQFHPQKRSEKVQPVQQENQGENRLHKVPEQNSTRSSDIGGLQGVPAEVTPQQRIADEIEKYVRKGTSFTSARLFEIADRAYGGTMAQGTYTVKDAYDGMELAVNEFLLHSDKVRTANGDAASAQRMIRSLENMLSHLPTQTKRTDEMEKFQQFSTPPTIAYTAAWCAGVKPSDTVLEPSAGIGGIALWPKAWGATVYANELSKRAVHQGIKFP